MKLENGTYLSDNLAGMLEWDIEKDRFDNPVSLVRFPDGKVLRMVGHSKSYHKNKRYSVYAGRGVFVKVEIYEPDRDTETTRLRVKCANDEMFEIEWGDGYSGWECLTPQGIEFDWSHFSYEGIDKTLLAILATLWVNIDGDSKHLWFRKEVTSTSRPVQPNAN